MAARRKKETLGDFYRDLMTGQLLDLVKDGGVRPGAVLYASFLRAQIEILRGLTAAAEAQLKVFESVNPRAKRSPSGPKARKKSRRRRVPVK